MSLFTMVGKGEFGARTRRYLGSDRWVLFGYFGCGVLFVIGTLADGWTTSGVAWRMVGLGFLLASLILAVRALRTAVLVRPSGVVVRTLLWTRRFDWQDVGEFAAVDHRAGWSRRRAILVMDRKDGRRHWLAKEFTARQPSDGSPSVAETVADELNDAIAARRARS